MSHLKNKLDVGFDKEYNQIRFVVLNHRIVRLTFEEATELMIEIEEALTEAGPERFRRLYEAHHKQQH